MIEKPAALNGREREWRAVTRFTDDRDLGAKLGLVYGRRRQGKTFMLDLLAEATGGFMFTAVHFSRTGFTAEVRRSAAERADIELIDLERLYDGE